MSKLWDMLLKTQLFKALAASVEKAVYEGICRTLGDCEITIKVTIKSGQVVEGQVDGTAASA